MRIIEGAEVRANLSYPRCISAVREAMAAFSRGETRQLLRSALPVGEDKLFGVMPGGLGPGKLFGAKLISVDQRHARGALPSHQGVVVLFDGETGAPVCVADGTEITAIRTAAASAVATDCLARRDATRLAILGTGAQAHGHALAIACVRPIASIEIWGRTPQRAETLAARLASETGIAARAAGSVEAAVSNADIICTVSAAVDPILRSEWVADGTHINLVGSSVAGPAEIDEALVARGRFIADSREGVLAQGGEFLRAKAAGLVEDGHVAGEIGAVIDGRLAGRQGRAQVTIYKSLGHIVQDLAAAELLYREGAAA